MSTAAMIGVEEYLATTYRPDCDFVDGTVLERNVGRNDYSAAQEAILAWFRARRRELQLRAFPEQRVRISAERYRVPDICVVRLPWSKEQILTSPPYICIEILSPDDSFPRMQERFDDFLAMGIPNIWVIEPESRRGWSISRDGHFEALDGILRTSDGRVEMKIADALAEAEL